MPVFMWLGCLDGIYSFSYWSHPRVHLKFTIVNLERLYDSNVKDTNVSCIG